ncbi:polysaccharide ABC transporter [Nonlabens tegetincola]|uniref:Polysaccharide ABC transporter n=1 Tax=Nonlabens tegetincola TaxID=323273 RepID=A0A090Q2P0_9FLAO|nr:ABC transporter ATP-binding protein [Nonlabens tegetincola]GAK96452.1 polysaccharide ABC transporter [Nonlabens tegetincola]
MSEVILKVENINKQYRLGTVGTGTLSHDLNRFWHKIRGKEDPYLKVGTVNDRSKKASSDYVWALRDINFEVKRGEILGIIGKNGAGKSTLLKILSRVTAPTTGSIKTKGRIASLLEVGTGMHPELTGRENIYLNGAILGMTKAEIASKLEEIVDFSGCEMYIDTPVKRYSSGMRVRLGFAVAAFLEPDILVVDEVLAVGDAEFQKKAIGKMQDISNTTGRTVLFVSHNMAAVKQLCTRGIVLENGLVNYEGDIEKAIREYISNDSQNNNAGSIPLGNVKRKYTSDTYIDSVCIKNKLDSNFIRTGDPIEFEFIISGNKYLSSDNIRLDFRIDDLTGNNLIWMTSYGRKLKSNSNINKVSFHIPKFPLVYGSYSCTVYLEYKRMTLDWILNAFTFNVMKSESDHNEYIINTEQAKFLIDYNVTTS